MPDLVIIDGGRGQVSAAKEVLDELGLHDLPLVGLAKEREELVPPGRRRARSCCRRRHQALYLVQRLRDEAHRFAITYHRSLRAKRRRGPPSTTCRASGPSAGASCSRCSGRRSACARRRWSRSRRCRASAARWPSGSRPTSRPEPRVAGGGTARTAARLYHPAPMRTRRPDPDHRHRRARAPRRLLPGSPCRPGSSDAGTTPVPRDQARASTCRAACGSSTRCCRPRARRRRRDDLDDPEARSSSTASTSRASRSPRSSIQGTDRIIVEMPGVQNADQIRKLVGTTGRLDFVPLGRPARRGPAAPAADLARSAPPRSPSTACCSPATRSPPPASAPTRRASARSTSRSRTRGKDLFANYTADHVGDYFAIVLDGKVITRPRDPRARSPTGRSRSARAAIGGYPLAEAQNLVTILQFGQLPFPIQELANTTVSPTLGEAFLHQSLARRARSRS